MDAISIILLLSAFLNLTLGLMVLINSAHNTISRLYFTLVTFVSFWILSNSFIPIIQKGSTAFFWAATGYLSAIGIAFSFLYFSYRFPSTVFTLPRWATPAITVTSAFVIAAIVVPGVTIRDIVLSPWHITTGSGIYLVFGYFIAVMAAAFYIVVRKLRDRALSPIEETQIKFVLWGTTSAAVLGSTCNLLLPLLFNEYGFIRLGPVFTLIMVWFIGIAIFKYRLFNIKLILAEILIFVIWILFLFNLLISDSLAMLALNLCVFAGIIFFGIFLIRAVIREVEAQERLAQLAEQVSMTNKRLEQIEQQKADFISIASHQLRTPLTAIKGYTSMLLEGSFGAVEKGITQTLQKMFISSQKLVTLVEDLLTVSRIERGKLVYNFAPINVLEVVRAAVKEKMPEIEDRKLGIVVQSEDDDDAYLVNGDMEKMKQIFGNIIDNSIKFTIKGLIRIYVSRDELKNRIRVSVSDTGVGMEPKVLNALFLDSEQRIRMSGEDGATVSGIGIYVVNQMVKAHNGKIWADSVGVGRGSTFFVEFPAYVG